MDISNDNRMGKDSLIHGMSRYKQIEPRKNISHLMKVNSPSNSSKTIVPRKISEGLNLGKILLRYKDDYLEWRMEMRGIIWSKVCSMKYMDCLDPRP